MHGQMKIFHVGSHQFQESLRELLRELWLSHCTSRETPFWEWDFAFRELFSELRELLREYPGTLPELREWLFTPRAFFLKLGWFPIFSIMPCVKIWLWNTFKSTYVQFVFRIKYVYHVRQSCWLLKLMVQICNYMTSKFVSRCVLGI